MSINTSYLNPIEAAKIVLGHLSSRRMRDVLEKRFGLKGGSKRTLEAVGKEYRITRERVRQIEADALKQLGNGLAVASVAPFFDALRARLWHYGEVMSEEHFFSALAERKSHPHLGFLISLGNGFYSLPENERFIKRWTVNPDRARTVEKILNKVIEVLESRGRPVPREELKGILTQEAEKVGGEKIAPPLCESYLAVLKCVAPNAYGEYGLVSWPSIRPRGIRDKAYLAFEKTAKPLHFREVSKAIDTAGWNRRKAHPQTVHNELIKDSRFVLVGRGLYALKEWGYEPGAVRDVLVSVFKQAGQPLSKEEVVGRVCEKRMVKAPTVLLNLQNRSLFKRTEDGRYTLA